MFRKLFEIFDNRQKGQFLVLGVMILIGGLFETLGVSMMVPVMSAVIDPSGMRKAMMSRPALASV